MAALRNGFSGLGRLHIPNIAAALRHLHPAAVVMVLGL